MDGWRRCYFMVLRFTLVLGLALELGGLDLEAALGPGLALETALCLGFPLDAKGCRGYAAP